jgi:hypothetical protein
MESRNVDLGRGESFGFLGFDFRRIRSRRGVWRANYAPKLRKGSSGNNVWARSYDRAVSDIFAVQDEITQTIVGAIEPDLSPSHSRRWASRIFSGRATRF